MELLTVRIWYRCTLKKTEQQKELHRRPRLERMEEMVESNAFMWEMLVLLPVLLCGVGNEATVVVFFLGAVLCSCHFIR